MNNKCQYCGCCDVATQLGYTYTCSNCVYFCGTCNKRTPFESGNASDNDCDECWAKKQNTPQVEAEKPEGESTMNKKVVSVIVFDEATNAYSVAGTKTTTELPEDLLTLLDADDDPLNEVKADLIAYEMKQTASLLNSQQRAKETSMNRADHSPVVMRVGEWNSLMYALNLLKMDSESANPKFRVSNGVDFQTLLDIVESQANRNILEKVVL